MARSKTYQMLMKISGDSSSLKEACEAASEHLDTLGNAAKAAGKVAATALAGIATAAAGIAVAATSVYTEHEKGPTVWRQPQLTGIPMERDSISRIESGSRYVEDYEVTTIVERH